MANSNKEYHGNKVKAAKAAIDRVFNDTLVSPADTRSALDDIIEHTQELRSTLPANE